jgi:hypothetical protein
MASIRIIGGQLFNAWARGVVTSSPAANPLFPVLGLGDGDAGSPFRFGSLTQDPYIQVDTDYLGGVGDFEAWTGGAPNGWTEAHTGTGDVIQETSITANGSSALRLVPGTGTSVVLLDVEVPAGHWVQFRSILYGGGAPAAVVKLQVENLSYGKNLSSAGTWGFGVVDVASRSVTGYNLSTVAFQVESLLAMGQETVKLRIVIRNDVAGSTGYADLIELSQGIDFASVHGHNVDPRNVVTLISDDFPAFGTSVTRATFTLARPSFYAVLGAVVYARYWRIKFTGINSTARGAIYLGEAVLGQQTALLRGSNFPIRTDWIMPQARSRAASRRQYVYNWGPDHLRTVTFPFSYRNLAQQQQARDEIIRRTAGGLHPLVIVPLDDDAETVIFGRIQVEWSSSQAFLNVREADLVIEEDPMPTFVG